MTGGSGGGPGNRFGPRNDGDFYDFEKCDCRPKGLQENALREVKVERRTDTSSPTAKNNSFIEVGSLTALHYQRIFRHYDAIVVPVKHTKPD